MISNYLVVFLMVNVVILCAGQGNRMLPLTQNKPKSLINFAGMSLLQRQINVFDEFLGFLRCNSIWLIAEGAADFVESKTLTL